MGSQSHRGESYPVISEEGINIMNVHEARNFRLNVPHPCDLLLCSTFKNHVRIVAFFANEVGRTEFI